MRRFLAPVLALLAACCLSTAALADDPSTPSWNLNIPADVAIAYRATDTSIGWVTVSDVENVSDSQWINCETSNTDLANDTAGIIPLGVAVDIYEDGNLSASHLLNNPFPLYDGSRPRIAYSAEFFALVDGDDWDAAAPGDYEATVTYISELRSF